MIPKITNDEPLAQECAHFIDNILDNKAILTDGADGLRAVQILEAGQKSLRNDGIPVGIGDSECPGRKNILPTSQRISSSPAKSAKAPKSGIFHT